MIVLPTAAALLLRKGYRFTAAASIAVSVASMAGGVVLSYYLEWKPGATSILIALALLLCILVYHSIRTLALKRKAKA